MSTIIVILFLLSILFIPYLFYTYLIAKYGKRKSPIEKNFTNKPTISIVVPTYNEELIISKKIDNILDLDYPLDLIEVIFIDSSNDKTPQIINSYQKKYSNIRLIDEGERVGLATALNKAYAAAK
ncbi:MAG: glycosyltransferase, partial [Methanosarcinales archaeon]|nr:glycosyltransferase [Methanosarcinales archaeon]